MITHTIDDTRATMPPTHTFTAENGVVSISRDGVVIYTFRADQVEEMSIEPRKFTNHTPCFLLTLRGAGPGGVLFATRELANEAMDVVINALRRTMKVFDSSEADESIADSVYFPFVWRVTELDVRLIAQGAKVGEAVVVVSDR